MKRRFFYFLSLIAIATFSQSEIDIAGIKYASSTFGNYYDDIYSSKINKAAIFLNYGHDVGKKTNLFYHASYHTINLDTQINSDNIIADDFNLYQEIPNYSFINLAVGMTNKLKNNWSLNNILSLTFSDNEKLKSHHYFRSFSYFKQKKSANFNYGFGIYLSKLNKEISIIPILSLQYKNKKRGVKIFAPRELKLWQSINTKSYIELQTILNSNYLKLNNTDLDIELLSVNTELTYNYIYNKKIKLKTGLGLPYTKYQYIGNENTYKTDQINLSYTIGFSYVVYKNVK